MDLSQGGYTVKVQKGLPASIGKSDLNTIGFPGSQAHRPPGGSAFSTSAFPFHIKSFMY